MLLFFIILPEQQGYRDNSCWLPPFRLRRVLSAILKKSRHKQSSARSFPVVSDFFFHVISGRFRSFPVLRDTRSGVDNQETSTVALVLSCSFHPHYVWKYTIRVLKCNVYIVKSTALLKVIIEC